MIEEVEEVAEVEEVEEVAEEGWAVTPESPVTAV